MFFSSSPPGFALKKRYINLEFTNTESFPITIRSSLVMSKFEMFFGNNPDTFVVDGAGVGSGAVGARKRITLSFWVYGQDVLNMKDSNMLELSASYNDHTMYMNGREGSFYLKTSHLQETSSGDYIQIKLSAPKGNLFNFFIIDLFFYNLYYMTCCVLSTFSTSFIYTLNSFLLLLNHFGPFSHLFELTLSNNDSKDNR